MRVAFLTAGGIAPCLSAAIGHLIKCYSEKDSYIEMYGYLHGYKGLLLGNSIKISNETIAKAELLYNFGGSPLGNSRVKLSNTHDCIKKGYIKKGQNPLEIAARQLIKDKIDVLHTIGGDDTNTTAGDLVGYLDNNGHELIVIGIPKTIDNDITPIHQTLGAWTAAEQGARYFENIINENTTSSRHLIIHEVMGRHCGWLTAATAKEYRLRLKKNTFLPSFFVDKDRWDIDAIYIPEKGIDLDSEIERLKESMDRKDSVNIFLSEGAGLDSIIDELEAKGEPVERDAFGHVAIDKINPGEWFAKQFSKKINADKVLIQKSGYFSRSSKANKNDLELIFKSVELAVDIVLDNGESGVVGLDEDNNNQLNCIKFERIKGGKAFDYNVDWFQSILKEIKQI